MGAGEWRLRGAGASGGGGNLSEIALQLLHNPFGGQRVYLGQWAKLVSEVLTTYTKARGRRLSIPQGCS